MLAKGAGPLVGVFLGCIIICMFLEFFFGSGFLLLSVIFFIALIFIIIFFRDPDRVIGKGIVAAADGVIHHIDEKDGYTRLETFMNIHNVHVNRAPIAGKIKKIQRMKGTYLPAYDKKAGDNEQQLTIIQSDIGDIRIVQIVGIFARRIVPYTEEGQYLSKGQRIGMIRFGSRVDVYLPTNKVDVKVRLGDKVQAGITSVADVNV